jgi:NADH-quinone oxidoreductase subunit D
MPADTVAVDVRTDELLVSMGPQHPSTHGVLRLVLRTDGEVIREVTPHLGYLHRCAEKVGENVTPIQFIPYTDRMDYLAAMNMNLGFSLAVERLCGLRVPEKADVLRVLLCELNRIASHLVGMGAYGLDLGTVSPFLYAFREREHVLDLFEDACGARLTYSFLTVGGAHDDLPAGWVGRCRRFLDHFRPKIAGYHALLTDNHIFARRTAGVGVLTRDLAVAHGCTGPVLRGSLDRAAGDPAWDLRKTEPYCGYDGYAFDVPVPPFDDAPPGAVIGDCWHRFAVRMREVVESVKLVDQALDRYEALQREWGAVPADSPDRATRFRDRFAHRAEPPRTLTPGEVYAETECPRGQMGFYVVGRPSKEAVPLRVRARSSCLANLSVVPELCRGVLMADVPAVVGSLDLVMGEIDR